MSYETLAIVGSSVMFLGAVVDHVLMRKSLTKHAAATELAVKSNQTKIGELFKRIKKMQLGWHDDLSKTHLFSGNSHLIDVRTGAKFDTGILDRQSSHPPPPFHDFRVEFGTNDHAAMNYNERGIAELTALRAQLSDD